MISALTGQLLRVDADRVQVKAGSMVFELLVPAADLTELHASLGEEAVFHTIFDLEGDPSRGGLSPRLIGFLRAEDKRFFERFVTVKGIGPKKALRALTVPAGQIAQAIESRDARSLSQLEGIGKRMAEQIVAELSGKVGEFATGPGGGGRSVPVRPQLEEEAILVCITLGIPRVEAEQLMQKAQSAGTSLKTADALSREMLRLRSGRS